MNKEAMKRLRAIQEFAELGSGYKIAQRDLMIRGAGDILGPEQAGFIDSIGLDLYLKMLNEAVEEKKTGVPHKEIERKKMFFLDAYIPGEYASNSDKLELYQELDEAKTPKEVRSFEKKVRDIYGRIPAETLSLIKKKKIDLMLENKEFFSIDDDPNTVDLLMAPVFSNIGGIGQELFNALTPYLSIIRVSFLDKRLRIMITKKENWIDQLEEILNAIHLLFEKKQNNK